MTIIELLMQQYQGQVHHFQLLLGIINAVLHILFAGAVARDAGNMQKLGHRPALVSSPTWAFATLIGGIFTAAIYWFIHHSILTRPSVEKPFYD